MIITHRLARQLRTVFRGAGFGKGRQNKNPPLVFQMSQDGLRIRGHIEQAAVEYHLAEGDGTEEMVLPFSFLSDCEGGRDESVTVGRQADGQVSANWLEGGIPQCVLYPDCRKQLPQQGFPPLPGTFSENDPAILPALAALMESTDPGSLRFALGCVQLRGSEGTMVATDSRQLLVHEGFRLPWDEEILLSHSPVFRVPELRSGAPVRVGKSAKHVTFWIGPWTVHLPIGEGRFPKYQDVIPVASACPSRFRFDSQDASYLQQTLKWLPAAMSPEAPLTVDGDEQVVVRVKGTDEPQATELVLTRSRFEGTPVRIVMQRRFLERALALEFRELHVLGPGQTALCQDERRKYVWMLLDPSVELAPTPQTVRVTSTADPIPVPPMQTDSPVTLHDPVSERTSTMQKRPLQSTAADAVSPLNGTHAAATASEMNGHAPVAEPTDPITEAEAIKEALREAGVRTNRLVAALRRQKKQTQLVRSTLASLRELQNVG